MIEVSDLYRDAGIADLALSPDGTAFMATYPDGTFAVYDVATGDQLWTFGGSTYRDLRLAFAPDYPMLAVSDSNAVVVWDLMQQQVDAVLDDVDRVGFGLTVDGFGALRFIANNSILLCDDGAILRRVDLQPVQGSSAGGDHMAYHPTENLVAVGRADGRIQLIDFTNNEVIRVIDAHDAPISYLAFSSDDTRVASAGRWTDVAVWDVATGEAIHEFVADKLNEFNRLAFSPDGRVLVVGGIGGMGVLDVQTGTYQEVVAGEGQRDMPGWRDAPTFNPEGDMVAYVAGWERRDVVICAVETVTERIDHAPDDCLLMLPHPLGVTDIAFMPDGRMLVTVSPDGIRFWQVMSQE